MKWQITGLDVKALEPLGFVQTCFLMASMPASPPINTGSLTPAGWLRPWLPHTSSHRHMRQGSELPSGRHRNEDILPAGLLPGELVGFLVTVRAEWVPAFHNTLMPQKREEAAHTASLDDDI